MLAEGAAVSTSHRDCFVDRAPRNDAYMKTHAVQSLRAPTSRGAAISPFPTHRPEVYFCSEAEAEVSADTSAYIGEAPAGGEPTLDSPL